MATIGLRDLYYSKITEDANGNESYATPKSLAKAMTVELSIELLEATLYADDGTAESVKEFKEGKLSIGIDDLKPLVVEDLTGCVIDSNCVIISRSADMPGYNAIGFRAKKSDGNYRYFWLYKVKFGIPSTSLKTKGDNIEFSTPTIEGTVYRRNKLDNQGNNPWKAEVTKGDNGVPAAVITDWFKSVYEPDFSDVTPTITIDLQPVSISVTAGSIDESLTIAASGNTPDPVSYQWYENTTESNTGGTIITGETSSVFNIPTDLTETAYYYCVVSLQGAVDVASEAVTVTVN